MYRDHEHVKSKTSGSSWGRIIIGHIISVVFGGLALVCFASLFFDSAYSTLTLIVLIIIGLAGALWGWTIRTKEVAIEIDENTGHAAKRKL